MNDRIAIRLEDGSHASELADLRLSQLRAAADVVCTLPVGGDGRCLDELLERRFEIGAMIPRPGQKRFFVEIHGGGFYVSSPPQRRNAADRHDLVAELFSDR